MSNHRKYKLLDSQLRGKTPCEICDGGGLYFCRTGPAQAHWYFRATVRGSREKTGLGPYPDITLKEARNSASECRKIVMRGESPKHVRNNKRIEKLVKPWTFAEAAKKKYTALKPKLRGKNGSIEWIRRLEVHAFPNIGKRLVKDLTVREIVSVLKPIWSTKHPTAKKVANRIEQVLKHANAIDERVNINLVAQAREILGVSAHVEQHLNAEPWQDMPKLFSALGDSLEHLAFKFYILTVVRVANARNVKWSEIDNDIWAVERMKSGKAFNVPLSDAARFIIETVRIEYGSENAEVFKNTRAFKHGVITENSFNNWLKDAGFKSTAHGVRSSFRDWCGDNQICSRDLAEMCLHHKVKNEVEAAYFRSDMLKQRAGILQKWSNHVSGGLGLNSPLIIRHDADGNDWALTLADYLEEKEMKKNDLDQEKKRKNNLEFENEEGAVAKWFRKTELEGE